MVVPSNQEPQTLLAVSCSLPGPRFQQAAVCLLAERRPHDAHLLLTVHVLWSAAYLVVADEKYGRQIPFAFLERTREEFQSKFAERARTAAAHSFDKSFG